MKRILCTLLAPLLLMPVLASAELCSVAQIREQAAQIGRWTKTYEAYGRTIEVDIPILVPDVDACPVATVKPLTPCTAEFLSRLREIGVYNDTYVEYDCALSGRDISPKADEDDTLRIVFSEGSSPSIRLEYNNPWDPDVSGTCAGFEAYFAWQLDESAAYAEDNPTTYGEALRLLRDIMASVYPDDARVGLRATQVSVVDRMRRNARQSTPAGDPIEGSLLGSYHFICDQTLFGLPVAWKADGKGIMITEDGRCLRGSIYATVIGDRQFSFTSQDPLTADEILLGDVPLASIADIITAIEREIEAGHIRCVHSLELGYLLGRSAQGNACVYPAWSLHCVYVEDPQMEAHVDTGWDRQYYYNVYEYGLLPILAQSAELLSPSALEKVLFVGEDAQGYGQYYDLSQLPTLMPWEDAN